MRQCVAYEIKMYRLKNKVTKSYFNNFPCMLCSGQRIFLSQETVFGALMAQWSKAWSYTPHHHLGLNPTLADDPDLDSGEKLQSS